MKRLHLAFPFTGLSGKFGSKQDLRYAENDNKAFYSPAGNVNYARNYQPCMVGAKVARTGLSYFTIKTKAAFKATADALRQCALMGATSAIYGISIANASLKAQMDTIYSLAKAAGYEGTFHKFVCMYIRAALASNAATIVVSFQGSSVNLGNNPFTTANTAIAITSKLLIKFWKQLTQNGIVFSVAGVKSLAISGNTWLQYSAYSDRIAFVHVNFATPTEHGAVDGRYILNPSGNEVVASDTIVEGNYTLGDYIQ